MSAYEFIKFPYPPDLKDMTKLVNKWAELGYLVERITPITLEKSPFRNTVELLITLRHREVPTLGKE